MVSKNNLKMRNYVMNSTKQRFGLRKLNIGLTSVLLGLAWTCTGTASADEVNVSTNENAETQLQTDSTCQPDQQAVVLSTTPETDNTNVEEKSTSPQTVTMDQVQTTESTTANENTISAEDTSATPINSTTSEAQPTVTQFQVESVGTIYDDQILKDQHGVNVDHLDANSVLLLTSLFHIFANEANLGCDVNGNIAAGILGSSIDFGTRGDSIHLTNGDIYYIQQLKDSLNTGSFRNPEFNHVVFGSDVNVEVIDGKVYVNGQLMNNLKPEEVFQDSDGTNYIDFSAVFDRLIKAADYYSNQSTSSGVVIDFSDMNNKFIDISSAKPIDNVIYINIPADQLAGSQPIKIYGLSSVDGAPTVVINVVGVNGKLDVSTQIHLFYDGHESPINNAESHAVPNHLLWNFGSSAAVINIASGRFMGSILAPTATINAYVNIDGNIVADVVNITGGESHRWDIHPVTPGEPDLDAPDIPDDPEIPDDPGTPDDPQPEEPGNPEPEEPADPTPEEPADPDPDTPDVSTPEDPSIPGTPDDSDAPVDPDGADDSTGTEVEAGVDSTEAAADGEDNIDVPTVTDEQIAVWLANAIDQETGWRPLVESETDEVQRQSSSTNQQQSELPQTSNQRATWISSLLGAALMILTFGLARRRKRSIS